MYFIHKCIYTLNELLTRHNLIISYYYQLLIATKRKRQYEKKKKKINLNISI